MGIYRVEQLCNPKWNNLARLTLVPSQYLSCISAHFNFYCLTLCYFYDTCLIQASLFHYNVWSAGSFDVISLCCKVPLAGFSSSLQLVGRWYPVRPTCLRYPIQSSVFLLSPTEQKSELCQPSIFCISSFFLSIIPPLYLRTATSHVLTVLITFPPSSFDSSSNLIVSCAHL